PRRRSARGVAAALRQDDTAAVRQTSVRRRVWEILKDAQPGDRTSRRFELFILALIALNVAAVVLESIPSVQERFGAAFAVFEACSVGVFVGEYAARLWSCVEDPRSRGPVRHRLRFAVRPLALVDVMAILPFFATMGTADMRVLRALRLLRLVRLLKLGRYLAALTALQRVVYAKRAELVMSSALTSVLLIVASSIMYYAEYEAQPDKFSSIPASMWWAVSTLTTVGYGDVYPVTTLGRVAGGFLALLGIGLFALPTAILGSGLVESVQSARPQPGCPHCGKPLR
ncbi:MAG TPA: ion transporter, partial [Longimicrobium sp.]|nr:ion transporter [Longimicrobium sp.]